MIENASISEPVAIPAIKQKSTIWMPLLLLSGIFLISRLIYFAAGVRFDMANRVTDRVTAVGSVRSYPWQLLDPNLLEHHLLVSVWNLNSQPPLFNFGIGILDKLPYAMQETVALATFLVIGLTIVLGSYAVMVELGIPRWLAMAIGVAIVIDPAYVLYENWLWYAYPTVALLILATLCLVRYVRTRQAWWGVGFFSAVAFVVLLNSTYQLPWLIAAGLICLVALGRGWRSAVVVAALPFLIAEGWVAKNTVQVGTVTTSSWYGMNLARTTLDTQLLDPEAIRRLVDHHVLTPLAEVQPFLPVTYYVPQFAHLHKTGVAAVDELSFDHGSFTNFNNPVYVTVSSQYLHDDLAFIQARPAAYATAVVDAAKLWTAPPDEYAEVATNRMRIAAWANLFDRAVLLRPAANALPVVDSRYYWGGPAAEQMSLMNLAIYAVALIGAPIVAWRRRRSDRVLAAAVAFIWMTTAYAFVTSSLVELGENQRFAMDLGPLPLIAAAVVVCTAWTTKSRRIPEWR